MKKMANPFLSWMTIPKSLSFNLFRNTSFSEASGNQDLLALCGVGTTKPGDQSGTLCLKLLAKKLSSALWELLFPCDC